MKRTLPLIIGNILLDILGIIAILYAFKNQSYITAAIGILLLKLYFVDKDEE